MMGVLLLGMFAVVTWCVASEGAWGAAFTLISVLLAGILATNYFEPLAATLEGAFGRSSHWDFVCFLGLFAGLSFAFRSATDALMPTHLDVQAMVYDGVRWVAAALTGYAVMAVVATSLHTANLPRTFLGFSAEQKVLFSLDAPDHRWLAFMQYMTEGAYRRGKNGPIFDGPRYAVLPGAAEKIWPSFPIRYAAKRGIGGGGAAGAGAEGLAPAPAPVSRPTGAPNF